MEIVKQKKTNRKWVVASVLFAGVIIGVFVAPVKKGICVQVNYGFADDPTNKKKLK